MGLNRRFFATSSHPLARAARGVRGAVRGFTLPAPRFFWRPVLLLVLGLRGVYYFLIRVLWCEPLFKAYCTRYGRGVRTGTFLHWIQGKGDLILGDYVEFDGKISIAFASRFSDRPTLTVGDHTGISHNCAFTVAKSITIGRHCRIASDVWMFDSSGHTGDPQGRREGLPPSDDDVRPIRIGDDVWIGRRVIIFPGVTVGDGSILSAGSVVMNDVAPRTIVAGNPARRIATITVPVEPAPAAAVAVGP